jgi:putative DNA primase/helicase
MNQPQYDTSCVIEEVPAELRSERRFLLYKLVHRDGKPKPDKVPCDASGHEIDATNPAHWRTLDEAVAALSGSAGRAHGVGVALGDKLAGIDLDGIHDPATGRLSAAAEAIVRALDSYTEVSPSGAGVHILVRGVLPDNVKHKAPLPGGGTIEAYSDKRFFTLSGKRLPGTPPAVHERSDALVAMCRQWGLLVSTPATTDVGDRDSDLDLDLLLVERARRGDRYFAALWAGDVTEYPSQSEADLALCMRLLQLTGGDTARADRLFRKSGLFRDKWDERRGAHTYGELTLQKARDQYREYLHEPLLVASRNGATPASPTAATGHDDAPPPWRPRRLIDDAELAQAARGGWLDDYVAYCTARTDAPANFHEAVGLVVLSSAVGRKAVLHLSTGPVVPALWVLLLAESTLYRKSTTLGFARDLLEALDPDVLAAHDFTPQRFLAILSEHDGRPLTLIRDEFGGFYDGLNRLDFQAGLKEALCLVYDGAPVHREKMKPRGRRDRADEDPTTATADWKFQAREPFLSIATATTPARFYELARPADVHSGFLARLAFEVPPEPDASARDARPVQALSDGVLHLRARLLEGLHALAQRPAPIRITCPPAVLDRFNRYARDVEADARHAPNVDLAAIVGSRVTWMALRVAVLLAVAEGVSGTGADRATIAITLPHLYRAMTIAERWRHTALRVLSDLAPSVFERQAARVVALVRRHPDGISRRDVMRALKLSRRFMDDLQATLAERGELVVTQRPSPSGPAVAWYQSPPPPPPLVTLVAPVTGACFTPGDGGTTNSGVVEHTLGDRCDKCDKSRTAGVADKSATEHTLGDRCDKCDKSSTTRAAVLDRDGDEPTTDYEEFVI